VWTFPILLDSRPRFLGPAPQASLLLLPVGSGTVLSHLLQRLSSITGTPPLVVAGFDQDRDYEQAIRRLCPEVEAVLSIPAFLEKLNTYEPSDHLLLADPECFPLDPNDRALSCLELHEPDARTATHVVALQGRAEGTQEFVDADASGRVRAIQRYYEAVTWPVAAGVACSRVPVSCLRITDEPPLNSLPRLRRSLAAAGIPCRDVALAGGAVYLGAEAGLLALNEQTLREIGRRAARDGPRAAPDPAPVVHESARLLGRVVLQAGAAVAEGAIVIGPAACSVVVLPQST